MAGDFGHQYMTRKSLEMLPSVKLEAADRLINCYCLDSFHHTPEGKPLLKLPNGENIFKPWNLRKIHVPDPGAGKDYFENGYIKHVFYVLDFYSGYLVKLIKKNQMQEFAQVAAIIGHFIQDASCPPHSMGVDWGVDMELIKLLVPPEDSSKALWQLHGVLENNYVELPVEDYSPIQKGNSCSEAAFNLCADFTDMLENSIAQLVPMTQALYHNDKKTIQSCLSCSALPAIKMFADLLFTAFRIAAHDSNDNLNIADLSRAVPWEWSAYAQKPYYCPRVRNSNMSLDDDFYPVPLRLNYNGKIETFPKGFGVGTPSSITFLIPSGVYNTFNAVVGLHSELGVGGKIIFRLIADDKVIFDSGIIVSDDSCSVSVKLGNCKKLTLTAVAADENENILKNNAIWANPTLYKKL
jgi:NPCBM/NEW2 domain